MEEERSLIHRPIDRRKLLGLGALAAATPVASGLLAERAQASPRASAPPPTPPHRELEDASIAELQASMKAGKLTSLELVRAYLDRIRALDMKGPKVNSVLELNPQAEEIARALDKERRDGRVRGPLHGIPILIKGNIDTADRMTTTAGSLALVGAAPRRDATVADKLRKAGAVILGKANLSEWANFR